MDGLMRIYRNGLYSFKGLYGFLRPQVYVLVKVINPVFQVLFFSLVARHAYGGGDITPYIIGNAFVLCMYNAFFGVGTQLVSERGFGTLKLLIASPCNKFKVFVTKSAFHILDGVITVLIGIITGIVFLKVRIPVENLPHMLLCLGAAMFAACSMGLIVGSAGLITRDINLLLNIASMALMALSGVNFPVERLPMVLQRISHILPLTHALKACRILLATGGIPYGMVNSLILKEFMLGAVYCAVAYGALKLMERISKTKATINIY